MNSNIRYSAPIQMSEGKSTRAAPPGEGYLPSGILIAMILKALREAQDSDLKRQEDQAEAEQHFYKSLGNLGGDPSKGIIAIAAAATARSGNEQAKGLKAMGTSTLIAGVIGGVALAGAMGYGFYKSFASDGLSNEIKTLNQEKDGLSGRRDADIVIAGKSDVPLEEGQEIEKGMDALKQGKAGDVKNPEAEDALKVDNQESIEEAKKAKDQQIKEKEEEKAKVDRSISNGINTSHSVSTTTNSLGQGIGSTVQAPHTIRQAAASASSDVTKNLQQMNTGSASDLRQDANSSRQQAVQVSGDLAQVAAAQVQMRG